MSGHSELVKETAEREKFECIYYKYRSLMYYRAREILRDDYLAEDAVSDAFLKIARNIRKIRQADSKETRHFVMIITERTAIDLYRKRKKRDTISFEEVLDEPACEDVGQELSPLAAAIVRLPADYRQAILLKFSEGYSNREIAKMLGFSVSKVEKLISRGRKKLETLLQEEDEEL